MVQSKIKSKVGFKGKADVAFVIDVTSSMGSCLENLKNNLVLLADKINDISKREFKVPEPELSFNAMGFRDLVEDEDLQIIKRGDEFTQDLNDIKLFFNEEDMKAKGGGDDIESSLDALYRAITEFKWEKPAKVLVLFTDAPPRKKLHKSTTEGKELDESQSMSVIKEKIISNKIRVIIFALKGVSEYSMISTLDFCEYIELEKVEETLNNFKEEELFKEYVIKKIAKTVSKGSLVTI